jgi:hypothetical protein
MVEYVVVYLVCGTHYRYRCIAKTAREAKKLCIENMGCKAKDIIEAYLELHYDGR